MLLCFPELKTFLLGSKILDLGILPHELLAGTSSLSQSTMRLSLLSCRKEMEIARDSRRALQLPPMAQR